MVPNGTSLGREEMLNQKKIKSSLSWVPKFREIFQKNVYGFLITNFLWFLRKYLIEKLMESMVIQSKNH